ncbi:hypothetical protein Y032_0058g2883 [Ancylostoma ceylanicum]|uniref:Uncharacterized protein n=1 Tax=Ancylostoma ceylanicum TaxID=53326 RepID=A0A016U3M6_9BILA|nr:hypothetical protein Y032_0058g2883 [Ancylostoma ceylanicum]
MQNTVFGFPKLCLASYQFKNGCDGRLACANQSRLVTPPYLSHEDTHPDTAHFYAEPQPWDLSRRNPMVVFLQNNVPTMMEMSSVPTEGMTLTSSAKPGVPFSKM